MRVVTMSQEQAEAYDPRGDREILIGIRDPGRKRFTYSPKFQSVLELEFHDVEDVHEGRMTMGDGGDCPAASLSLAQASEILDFVYKHADADVLVIHCAAGISRSVTVAQAIADTIGRYAPNRTVHRRLCAAFDMRSSGDRRWVEMQPPEHYGGWTLAPDAQRSRG